MTGVQKNLEILSEQYQHQQILAQKGFPSKRPSLQQQGHQPQPLQQQQQQARNPITQYQSARQQDQLS